MAVELEQIRPAVAVKARLQDEAVDITERVRGLDRQVEALGILDHWLQVLPDRRDKPLGLAVALLIEVGRSWSLNDLPVVLDQAHIEAALKRVLGEAE